MAARAEAASSSNAEPPITSPRALTTSLQARLSFINHAELPVMAAAFATKSGQLLVADGRATMRTLLVLFSAVAIGFGLAFVALLAVRATSWTPLLHPTWSETLAHLADVSRTGVWTSSSALSVPFWAALGETSLEIDHRAFAPFVDARGTRSTLRTRREMSEWFSR